MSPISSSPHESAKYYWSRTRSSKITHASYKRKYAIKIRRLWSDLNLLDTPVIKIDFYVAPGKTVKCVARFGGLPLQSVRSAPIKLSRVRGRESTADPAPPTRHRTN